MSVRARRISFAMVLAVLGVTCVSTYVVRAQRGFNPGLSKSSAAMGAVFTSITHDASKSTVRIFIQDNAGRRPAALGTIVSEDGFILTKASEVVAQPKILVALNRADQLKEAKITGQNEHLDLAMLKIDAQGLTPIKFSDTRPAQVALTGSKSVPSGVSVEVGEWIASADAGASAEKEVQPRYVGVISVTRRAIAPPNRRMGGGPFIGISYGPGTTLPEHTAPKIVEAVADSGAAQAGIRGGDIITAIDGWPVESQADVTKALDYYNVGDAVAITVLRGTDTLTLRVVLGQRPELPPEDPEFQLLSGAVSKRTRDFPAVFQHDSLLDPTDCGGPLVDLEGHVIGINIARAGRTEAYALPADVIVPIIDSLKVNRLAAYKNRAAATEPSQK